MVRMRRRNSTRSSQGWSRRASSTQFPVPPEAYRFADIAFQGDTPVGGVTKNDSWDDVSPRVVLDYKVNPDVMWFGSIAKGYKAGGYNSVQVNSEFENEDVWNFETGVKSAFPSAGVVLNASTFYYVYKNKQSLALVTGTEGSELPQYLVDTSDEQAWGLDVDATMEGHRSLHPVRQRRVHQRDVQGQDDAGR